MSNLLVELGHQFFSWVGRHTKPGIRNGLYSVGLALSPSVTFSDEGRRLRRHMFLGTLALVPFVWIFSLGFNALFSYIEGQFWWDSNRDTINFLEDRWNLALYFFVTPLYVAVSLQIIMISSRYGKSITDATRPETRLEAIRSPIAFTLCLAIAAVVATKYIIDVAVGPNGDIYWFNDVVEGTRVLNRAGAYYCFLVFTNLSIIVVAAFNYISITLSAVRLANSISNEDCKNQTAMMLSFRRFNQAFVFGRWLIAITMIHVVIWSLSPLSGTDNVYFAAGALLVAAFLLTAIPAYHVDRNVKEAAQTCAIDLERAGIALTGAKKWQRYADGVIGLGFGSAIFGVEPLWDLIKWFFGQSGA